MLKDITDFLPEATSGDFMDSGLYRDGHMYFNLHAIKTRSEAVEAFEECREWNGEAFCFLRDAIKAWV